MKNVTINEFLAPVTAALGRSKAPEFVKPLDHNLGPERALFANMSHAEAVQLFKEQARALGTMVVETTPAELGSTLASMINEYEPGTVVYADDPRADAYDIPQALFAAGLTSYRWSGLSGAESVQAAENASIGVTFARYGIAETGTIVQESGQHSGRSIALLPFAHLAILRKTDIKRRMADVMAAYEHQREQGEELPTNITLISGPSVTADIELVRVVGVHGAIHTGVLLVDE